MPPELPVKREDPFIGKIFDRKYQILRLLGVGGAGTVYAAHHVNLERTVAIKILHPQFVPDPRAVERFRREARVMGMIGHESIASVIDFRLSADTQTPYLVMELVEGENLRERLRRGPLSFRQALGLFRPLCEALSAAHQQGVIHRDLKPENLMLRELPSGQVVVKILDFGASKLLHHPTDAPLSSVQAPGTPYYLAPERILESPHVDHRQDIFSLGAILYEVLTANMAFGSDNQNAAMFKILDQPVPKLELADPRLSGALDAVIARACAKHPDARFRGTTELLAALQSLEGLASPAPLFGAPPQSRPPDSTPQSRPPGPSLATAPTGPLTRSRPSALLPSLTPGAHSVIDSRPPPSMTGPPGPIDRHSLLGTTGTPPALSRTPQGPFSPPRLRWETPSPQPVPRPPQVLSGGPGLLSGVKQAVILNLTQQLSEMAGPVAEKRLGEAFMKGLSRLVLTDWVDGIEMRRIFSLAGELLGGEGGQRLLGRALATVMLSTIYKSLVKPGEPDLMLRRVQVLLRLIHSEGEGVAHELSPGRFRLRISRLRTLDVGVAVGTAGIIEGALMMAGALSERVTCLGPGPAEGDAPPPWDFEATFDAT